MIFQFKKEPFKIQSHFIHNLTLDFIPTPGSPKILLIHGAQGSSRAYFPLMAALANTGYEPWAINLRGHGTSVPMDLSRTHIADYLNDIDLAMKHINPSFLLGHSMGGILAQQTAFLYPQIKKLILMSSVPPSFITMRISHVFLIIGVMIKYSYLLFLGRTVYQKKVKSILGKKLVFNKMNKETFRDLLNAIKEEKEAVNETPHLLFDLIISKIRKIPKTPPHFKTLVFGSKYDFTITQSSQKKIAKYYKAPFFLLENSGHMSFIENDFDFIVEEMKNFLQ